MKSTTNNFTNELGNKIKLRVSKENSIDGKNSKTGQEYDFDGVNIWLEGPTSVSENTITYQEAWAIHQTLGKFLKANKQKKSNVDQIE